MTILWKLSAGYSTRRSVMRDGSYTNWSHFVNVVDDVIPLERKKQVSEVTLDVSNDKDDITHVDLLSKISCIISVSGVTLDDSASNTDIVKFTSFECLCQDEMIKCSACVNGCFQ